MHCHPWETHDDEGDVDDDEGDVDNDEGDVDDVEGDVDDDEGDVGQKGKIFIKQFVSICLLQHELWTMTTDQEIWAVGYFLLFRHASVSSTYPCKSVSPSHF